MKIPIVLAAGTATGFLNGLLGAGGGMVAVPLLRALGLSEKESHATSIAVILPLSLLSGFLYLRHGRFALTDALIFLPGGALGAIVGAFLLKRLSPVWIRKVFGILVLYSAVRLLLP